MALVDGRTPPPDVALVQMAERQSNYGLSAFWHKNTELADMFYENADALDWAADLIAPPV